jgi:hypothetical protein
MLMGEVFSLSSLLGDFWSSFSTNLGLPEQAVFARLIAIKIERICLLNLDLINRGLFGFTCRGLRDLKTSVQIGR